jgi:DNA-binding NarL/FixJ family response regulator
MRVLLAGTNRVRERLRAQLEALAAAITVVGEFQTLDEANASQVAVDAVLSAPDVAHLRTGDLTGQDEERVDEPLTAREVEVLEWLAEGLPNKRIAARLAISDQTVKFHVASIMAKLGAANRVETVRRAVRRGLVSL